MKNTKIKAYIFFDSDIYFAQKQGGISRYFSNLQMQLAYINKYKNHQVEFISSRIKPLKINNYSVINKFINFHLFVISSIEIYLRYISCRRKKLIHFTYQKNLLFLLCKRYVVTVHDLIPELYSDSFPYLYKKLYLPLILFIRKIIYKKSFHIIAISENTKSDLQKFYKINPSKISVVYHGCDHMRLPDNTMRTFNGDSSVTKILYIGKRNGYKNFNTLIDALKIILLDSKLNFELVCVGNKFSQNEMFELKKYSLTKSCYSIQLKDQELSNYYSKANFLVYPSIYEGFGIPILESFNLGCPVICSDINVFHEIADNKAIYFDPFSSEDLAKKITECSKINFFNPIDLKNYSNSFKWNKTARETLAIYKELLFN